MSKLDEICCSLDCVASSSSTPKYFRGWWKLRDGEIDGWLIVVPCKDFDKLDSSKIFDYLMNTMLFGNETKDDERVNWINKRQGATTFGSEFLVATDDFIEFAGEEEPGKYEFKADKIPIYHVRVLAGLHDGYLCDINIGADNKFELRFRDDKSDNVNIVTPDIVAYTDSSWTPTKYEFTGETKLVKVGSRDNIEVHRIRRLFDGKIGGWIEKESNLSHNGNCWVDDNAIVCDDAKVSGDVQIKDNCIISGSATVGDYIRLNNNCIVSDTANLIGNMDIYGSMTIYENANLSLYGDDMRTSAHIHGNTTIYGDFTYIDGDNIDISGDVKIGMMVQIQSDTIISGHVKLGTFWEDIPESIRKDPEAYSQYISNRDKVPRYKFKCQIIDDDGTRVNPSGAPDVLTAKVPDKIDNVDYDAVIGKSGATADEEYYNVSIFLNGNDELYDTDADPGVWYYGCPYCDNWGIDGVSLKKHNSKLTIKIPKKYPYLYICEMCNMSTDYADGVDNHVFFEMKDGRLHPTEKKTDVFMLKVIGDIKLDVEYRDRTGYNPTFIYRLEE